MVGWLGLPAVAGLTLLLSVLRKELALQMLVVFAVARYGVAAHDLRTFMTPHQIVVYALVAAIFIPCIATIVMLWRELGWRRTAAISTCNAAVCTRLAPPRSIRRSPASPSADRIAARRVGAP